MLDEEIDDFPVLREDFSELVSLFLGGELERALGRTLDLHPGILIIPTKLEIEMTRNTQVYRVLEPTVSNLSRLRHF